VIGQVLSRIARPHRSSGLTCYNRHVGDAVLGEAKAADEGIRTHGR